MLRLVPKECEQKQKTTGDRQEEAEGEKGASTSSMSDYSFSPKQLQNTGKKKKSKNDFNLV